MSLNCRFLVSKSCVWYVGLDMHSARRASQKRNRYIIRHMLINIIQTTRTSLRAFMHRSSVQHAWCRSVSTPGTITFVVTAHCNCNWIESNRRRCKRKSGIEKYAWNCHISHGQKRKQKFEAKFSALAKAFICEKSWYTRNIFLSITCVWSTCLPMLLCAAEILPLGKSYISRLQGTVLNFWPFQ